MPTVTVDLPDDLFEATKELARPVSDLLQEAIRRELALEEPRAEAERLVDDLEREHGAPSAADLA